MSMKSDRREHFPKDTTEKVVSKWFIYSGSRCTTLKAKHVETKKGQRQTEDTIREILLKN